MEFVSGTAQAGLPLPGTLKQNQRDSHLSQQPLFYRQPSANACILAMTQRSSR